MPRVAISSSVRQAKRGTEIADTALAAPENQQTALKILAPSFKAESEQFLEADAEVSALERSATKENGEAATAAAALCACYDELLPVAQSKAGFTGGAASTYATDTDLFAGAEAMEACFEERKGDGWAQAALDVLSPTMNNAARESTEHVQADRDLQKAKAARAAFSEAFRAELLPFRRAVRATFGTTSREYHDLKDPESRPRNTPPEGTPPAV